MAGRTWPPEDRDEYEVACNEAWDSAEGTRERGSRFLEIVRDAAQAHRIWACDLLSQFMEAGAQAELKRWRKANQKVVAVSHDGRILSRPRVVGVRIQNEDGVANIQTLYDYMTFEQIEQKVAEFLRQVSAYRDNIFVATLLLELRELAPGATTPHEAAERLGTTVDIWLDQRTAA